MLDESFPAYVDWQKLHPRSADVDCPHCGRALHVDMNYEWLTRSGQAPPLSELTARGSVARQLQHYRCIRCDEPVVSMQVISRVTAPDGSNQSEITESVQIWPRSTAVPSDVALLPDELQRDAREALEIAAISPRASAALARRFVQHFLLVVFEAPPAMRLQGQIDWALKEGGLRGALRDQLHAVRRLGNLAAHPDIDNEGVIVDVEPHEVAVLGLVIESLAAHYAADREQQARVAAIHERLDGPTPDGGDLP